MNQLQKVKQMAWQNKCGVERSLHKGRFYYHFSFSAKKKKTLAQSFLCDNWQLLHVSHFYYCSYTPDDIGNAFLWHVINSTGICGLNTQ